MSYSAANSAQPSYTTPAPEECPTLDEVQLEALAQLAGSKASNFLQDLLNTFENEAEAAIFSLQQAINESNSHECSRLLHFLSGGASNLGLKKFHSLCHHSCQMIAHGKSPSQACSVTQLSQTHNQSIRACRAWIAKLS